MTRRYEPWEPGVYDSTEPPEPIPAEEYLRAIVGHLKSIRQAIWVICNVIVVAAAIAVAAGLKQGW